MAVNALLADWQNNADGVEGRVRVVWEDGHSQVFDNIQDASEKARACNAGLESVEAAECMLILWFLARQPNGSNTNVVEGKRLTLDWSDVQPIRVQQG